MSVPAKLPFTNPSPGLLTNIHQQGHVYGRSHGHGPNPKSILTDRTQQSQHSHTIPIETGSLRVTFAKINSPKQQSFANSLLNFQHGQNTTERPGTAASPLTKTDKQNPKGTGAGLMFGGGGAAAAAAGRPLSPGGREKPVGILMGNDKVKKAYEKGKWKAGVVDVLYTDNKPRALSGSSVGFIPGKKSEDSVGRTSKASEKSTLGPAKEKTRSKKKLVRKATNKSVAGTATRRKSGKKLKKRKKSKFDDELEKELTKPAQLNEEYAQELNKITQILKAVSAFDEGTSTEGGTVGRTRSHMENETSFFTYQGLTTTKPPPNKSNPKRPLSGDELKQLLSSITRVVSLHQLPLQPGQKPGTAAATNSLKKDNLFEDPFLDKVPSPTTSTKSKKKKTRKVKKVQPKYPTFIEGSQSDPNHKKPANARNSNAKNTGGVAAANLKSKSKASIGRPKPKQPVKKPATSTGRPNSDGGDSVESLEKDPVKHAAFLRKYFEESIRLANKKSSEDLLALGAEAAVVTPGPGPNSPSVTETDKKKQLKAKKSIVKKA